MICVGKFHFFTPSSLLMTLPHRFFKMRRKRQNILTFFLLLFLRDDDFSFCNIFCATVVAILLRLSSEPTSDIKTKWNFINAREKRFFNKNSKKRIFREEEGDFKANSH